MKVLHLGKYYYPERGGIETMVQGLAEGSQLKGHVVSVICCSPKNSCIEHQNGVKVIRVRNYFTLFSQPIAPLYLLVALREIKKTDVIHLHTPHPGAELVAFISTFINRDISVVVTHHSDVVSQKNGVQKFHRWFYGYLLKRCKRIVVGSPKLTESSLTLKPYQKSVIPISMGIPAPLPRPTQLVTTKFCLFVGRLVAYKGVECLLRATQKTNIRLVIIGDGPLREDLETRAFQLNLRERVQFLGSVDPDILNRYLWSCEILVLPSITRAEAFGLTLVEAMARKKAVISTKLDTGIRTVNQDRVTGIEVEPNNEDELAAAIQLLMTNSELSIKYGEAGYLRYVDHFTVAQMVESYLKVYQECLAQTQSHE